MSLVLLAFAFSQASPLEARERLLREELGRLEASRPAGAAELEAWDRKLFDAQWEYGVVLFRLAEERKSRPLYEQTIRHFTDFIWTRDDYLAALQARIYLARAHQALEQWGPCFSWLAQARVTDKPAHRANPQLVEIATQSIIAELRARIAFRRNFDVSLSAAQAHLKRFAPQGETPLFVAMRIEMGRVLHAAGRWTEAEALLREVWTSHAKEELGESALADLAELFRRAQYLEPLADLRFRDHHFTEAVTLYRRLDRTPRVWLRIGLCYAHLRRPLEAAAALEEACRHDFPDRTLAALRLERILAHLVARGEAAYRPRLEAHRQWMLRTLDLKKLGPGPIRDLADSRLDEGKHAEAAELYARIAPGEEGYEEAVRARAYCRFKLKDYAGAAEGFASYLGLEKRTSRGSDVALEYACRALLELGRAEEVLALAGKANPRDPATAQWCLAHRVDALSRLGRFPEAQDVLASMKEDVAFSPVVRALERLALAYEAALRKTGDRKLWGSYARTVVALSRKTSEPLRGEKLLAAADALSLEGTAEGSALAFELYGEYLLDPALRPAGREPVTYRRARAALGAGKLQAAMNLATDLLLADSVRGSYRELQGDVFFAQAQALRPSGERNRLLDEAIRVYGTLYRDLSRRPDEHYFRVMEKYANLLFLRDPERAREFFATQDLRGEKEWDGGRWGTRERMEALRKKVHEIVPARRRTP